VFAPAEATEEDFDAWSDAHAHRFLTFDHACEKMRPHLGARFEMLAQHASHPLFCPFTLIGLATLEKQMGRYEYQPVANACGFPMHPNCPQRSGQKAAPCHCHQPPSWSALRAHVRDKSDELHKMFLEELYMIRSRRSD
jgi:hypothetical protein